MFVERVRLEISNLYSDFESNSVYLNKGSKITNDTTGRNLTSLQSCSRNAAYHRYQLSAEKGHFKSFDAYTQKDMTPGNKR